MTLASLILVGGSMGDVYGRRRIYLLGVGLFGATSVVCALAPNIQILIGARVVQGVGGALMTPASLAIIQANFHPDDRGRAIGYWTGLIGIAAAIGPFVGGWLTENFSWRYVFILNVPIVATILIFAPIKIGESRDRSRVRSPDLLGAITATIFLGASSYALIEFSTQRWSAVIISSVVLVAISLIVFVFTEMRSKDPMIPLGIFKSTQFSATNVVTLVVYAALSGTLFLTVLQLRNSLAYSPSEAGLATLPITVLMLVLSSRVGAFSARNGPRLPMTVGPIVVGLGLFGLSLIAPDDSYVAGVFPWMCVFGIGLSITVAPLTVTVLASAPTSQAGIASGINNAIARAAGLLAVAALPLLVGLKGTSFFNPTELTNGYHDAMLVCGTLSVIGGLISWAFIRNPKKTVDETPAPAVA